MNILQIGMGAVGKCLNELFHLEDFKISKLTVIEPLDIPSWVKYDRHIKVALTPENLNTVLKPLIKKDTYVIDVSVDVDCIPIMEICKKVKAKYINTSLEGWDEDLDDGELQINKDTVLFYRMNKAKKVLQNAKSSLLVDNGANPGMVSSFVKQCLKELAEKYNDEESSKLIAQEKFNIASQRMGLEVIHISELDTQESKKKLKKDTFYNTWSCTGFISEMLDPVSIGYGSCENNKDRQWIKPTDSKNPVVRIMKKRGCDVIKKSYCPDHNGKMHKIEGYCIPHGESYTICKMLQYKNYRPSVYYVYCCSPPAIESINTLKENNYIPQKHTEVLPLEQLKTDNAFDSVGTLLFFSGKGTIPKIAHWYGSSLSIKQVKKLGFKHSGSTTVQVSISLLNALRWIHNHQKDGFMTPEDLNYKYILDHSKKYLGNIISTSQIYDLSSPLNFNKF